MARAANLYEEAKQQGLLWTPQQAGSSSTRPTYWLDASNGPQIDTGGVAQWTSRGPSGTASNGSSGSRPALDHANPTTKKPTVVWETVGKLLSFTRTYATGITGILGLHEVGEPFSIHVATSNGTCGNALPVSPHVGVISIVLVSGQSYNESAGVFLRQNGTPGTAFDAASNSGITSAPNYWTMFFAGYINDAGAGGSVGRIIEHGATAYVGNRAAGDRTLQGGINELICCGGPLATWERDAYEGYLAWKWDYQRLLVPTHPYAKRPPLIGL